MAADFNKVFLMGRLTFDPELRRIPSGTAVVDLRLATSRTWTSPGGGEPKKETLYIDVTVWDRQAENCCQYLKKGSAIHVEGHLKMDSWDDKTTGEKRTKIKVQADRVMFLDRRDDSGGGPSEQDYGGMPQAREVPPPRRSSGMTPDTRGYANGSASGSYPPQGNPAPRRPAPPADPVGEDEDIPF